MHQLSAKQAAILLGIFVFLFSCASIKNQKRNYKKILGVAPIQFRADTSVFSPNENLFDVPSLSFYYVDSSITGSSHLVDLKLNEVPIFFFKTPGFITQNDNTGNFFYTYPGSQLKAILSKDGYIEFVDLKGDEQRNNELNFFQKLAFNTISFGPAFDAVYLFSGNNEKKAVSGFYKSASRIDSLKTKRLQFLDATLDYHPMSKAFVKVARQVIQYLSIRDSLVLYHNYKEIMMLDGVYISYLSGTLKTINSMEERPTHYFNTICQIALNLLTNKPPEKTTIETRDHFFNNVDTITKYFSGLAKDYLLYDQYRRASGKFNVEDEYVASVLEKVEDPEFRQLVSAVHQEYKRRLALDKGDKLISLNGRTERSLEALLAKHKGKLVFIDFWASWCEPCRREMPFVRKLMEQYKGRDIAFLFISIDENEARWKVGALVTGLTNENSLRMVNYKLNAFLRRYDIQEIPRYMLVGKNGDMLYDDAPAPSESKLSQLINEHLGE